MSSKRGTGRTDASLIYSSSLSLLFFLLQLERLFTPTETSSTTLTTPSLEPGTTVLLVSLNGSYKTKENVGRALIVRPFLSLVLPALSLLVQPSPTRSRLIYRKERTGFTVSLLLSPRADLTLTLCLRFLSILAHRTLQRCALFPLFTLKDDEIDTDTLFVPFLAQDNTPTVFVLPSLSFPTTRPSEPMASSGTKISLLFWETGTSTFNALSLLDPSKYGAWNSTRLSLDSRLTLSFRSLIRSREHAPMLDWFLNRFNPTGAEPVPESSLLYVASNGSYLVPQADLAQGTGVSDRATINFVPGKTYRLRFINSESVGSFDTVSRFSTRSRADTSSFSFPPFRLKCPLSPCSTSGWTDMTCRSSRPMEFVTFSSPRTGTTRRRN